MGLTTLFGFEPVPAVREPQREARGLAKEQAYVSNPAEWMVMMFGGGTAASGVTVTASTAMESTPFRAGVRVIAEDLASLPLITYRRLASGKARAQDFHLYPILHDAPNAETDSMQFVETLTTWAASQGIGYAEIVRRGNGEVESLWQIDPSRVTPMRVTTDRTVASELVFHVRLPQGQTTDTGADYVLMSRDRMFRLSGPSIDGVSGASASPVKLHAEAIGLTIALERHGARFFGNGASPGGVIEHPAKLGDVAYNRLKAAWESRHKGLENAHRLAILEEGMKWHETSLANDKAQFLESRKFQVRENARMLRVKPHKIGDLENATFSNIEHESIDHVVSTVRPWAVRWERAVSVQLLTAAERETYFAEFLLDALLRGDMLTRAQTLAIKRQNGVINADEWRALDNENPLPNGQGGAYLVQVNMTTLEKLMAPEPDPAPPPPAPPAAEPSDEQVPPPEEEDDEPEGEPPTRALLPVFEAAVGRLARRHGKAVQGAARKARDLAGFEAWARTYFTDEAEAVEESLEPVVRAAARLGGADEAAVSAHVAAAARRYCRLALEQLGDAVRALPTDLASACDRAAEAWEAGIGGVAGGELEAAAKLPRAAA